MKSKKASLEAKILSLKPKDLVSIKTIWADVFDRYLVIRVSRKQKSIDILHLEGYYRGTEYSEAPVLSVPFSMISDLLVADKGDLLFLANHNNPHIVNALESL